MKALLHYLLASVVVETSEEKTSALFYEAWKLVEAFLSLWGSLVAPWNAGDLGSIPGSGSSPGEGNGNPFLPAKSHGRRSLAGYSPWGHKESDTTEQLRFLFSFSSVFSLCNNMP